MRSIPPLLAAEMASGATTLCRCWKALRQDGKVFGFTDHDRDIAFAGVTFMAATGLEASEAESLLGLAVGGGEVAGALQAQAITEADIDAGLWDNATIETWLVDWRDATRRMLLDAGQIGEIRRQGEGFKAEVRSLAHVFDQERGRRYAALCSAELGDSRCRVDITLPSRRVQISVLAVPEPGVFAVSGLSGFSPGSFSGGTFRFASASNEEPIMGHTRSGSYDLIALWSPPSRALAMGDAVVLTVGCDKRFDTCRDRFANAANHRGFPHIPGNDFLLAYARQGEAGLDGGAMAS